MWWTRMEHGVFADPPVPLTSWQLERATSAAQRAARQSRGSLTRTARRQYRRYRERTSAGYYLDWTRWRDAYLREYRSPTIGPLYPPTTSSGMGGVGP